MRGYPLTQLYEEMAFVAYHFHWSCGDLLELEHPERRRWCERISAINRRMDESPKSSIELM